MSEERVTRTQLLNELARLRQRVTELEMREAAWRQTEAALHESERIYSKLFEASTDAIFLETPEGKVLDCNEAACHVFGYTRQEFLHLTVEDLVPPDVALKLSQNMLQEQITGGILFKTANKRKNGQVFPVEVSTQALTIQGEPRYVTYVRDITAQENAAQLLDQRMQELIAIYDTTMEIRTQLDLSKLLHAIVERAVNLIGAPMGGLYLLQPDGETLKLVVSYHLPQDYTGVTLHLGEGLSGRIAQTGKTMIVDKYHTWPGKAQVYSGSPFTYVLGVPLKIENRVIGVINITDIKPREPYSDQQIQLITLFANQAAVAIHNAQLLEASQIELVVRKQAEKVQAALYRISEATQTAQDLGVLFRLIHGTIEVLMPARNFYIALYDASTDLISYPYYADQFDAPPPTTKPVRGLTEYVLQRGQPLLVTPEVYQELQASGQVDAIGAPSIDWLGVPLMIQNEQIGMMAVQSYTPQERYSQADQDVLAFVSTQVAMAIERKRNDEALRHSGERYRLLFENAPVGILLINTQGTILEVNSTALQILGSPSAEATKSINVLTFAPIIEVGFSANVQKSAETGQALVAECLYTSKWGKPIQIHYYLSPILDADGRVNLVQAILEDVTERKQAEQEIQRLNQDLRYYANELSILNQASQVLASTLDLDLLYNLIADQTKRLLHVEVVLFLLAGPAHGSNDAASDQPGNTFIAAGSGLESEKLASLHMALKTGIDGWVIREKRSALVADAQNDPRICNHSESFNGITIQAVLAVPLMARGKVLGVIEAINKTSAHFDDHDQELLEALCSSAAIALENARLLTETQRRAEQFGLLYDAGIALNRTLDSRAQVEALSQIAMQALHADNSGFFRYDAARDEIYYAFGVGRGADLDELRQLHIQVGQEHGLIGWIAQQRTPFYLPDVTLDPRWIAIDPIIRSVYWVPIEHEARLLGLLSVASTQPDAFSLDDQRLLMLFANQVAVALDKLWLFEAERDQREFAETLSQVSTMLTSTLDAKAVLDLLLEEVGRVVPNDASNIILIEGDNIHLVRQRGYDRFGQAEGNLYEVMPLSDFPLFSSILNTGKTLVISDVNTHADWVHYPGLEWQRSYVGAPIQARDTSLGFLNMYSATPGLYQQVHGMRLRAFADQAAIALDNARLYQTAVNAGEHRNTLHWLSQEIIHASLEPERIYSAIYRAALKLMPAEAFIIALLDETDRAINLVFCIDQGQRYPGPQIARGQGLSGYVTQSGTTVIMDDIDLLKSEINPVHIGTSTPVRSILAVPMRLGERVLGMLSSQSYQQNAYSTEDANHLEILAASAAIALENARIFAQMQAANVELTNAYEATIEGWSRALEMRDKETKGHSDRVTRIALRLALELGLSDEELVQMRRGVLLHDIGKMAIPDHILLKPGPLSDDEWQVMHQHPQFAYRMLSGIPFLKPALDIPYCHHENWDGSGYPRGLKGKEIPLGARIFALVDVWDALLADRPYRMAWMPAAIRSYILQQSGTRFDPDLIPVFLKLLDTGEFQTEHK